MGKLARLRKARKENPSEASTYFLDAIRDLAQETVILGGIVNTTADAEAALSQSQETAKARMDALLQAITNQTEAQERLQKATAALATSQMEAATALVKIIRDRDARIAEVERQRTEAAAEAAASIVTLEERSAKNVLRIRQDAGDDIEEALRQGDAVSARRARRARDQAVKDQQDQTAEQKQQIEARLQQARLGYDREIETIRTAAAERLAEEQTRIAAELKTRRDALAQAQADLQNANTTMQSMTVAAQAQRETQEVRHQTNLNEIARQGGQALAGLVQNVFETIKGNFQATFANLLSGYFLGQALQGQYGTGGGSLGSGSGSIGTGIGGIRSGGLGGSSSRSAGFLPSMTAASRMSAASGGSQSVNLSFDLRGAAGVNVADLTRQVERQIVPRITQAIREAQ